MVTENTAGFVTGGKYREDRLFDALHPQKQEEIKDPEAEAVKRLNRMGLEVV